MWVKRDGLAMSALLPLYSREPTFIVRGGMSQSAKSGPSSCKTFGEMNVPRAGHNAAGVVVFLADGSPRE
jgi:hypothetical protein